MLCNDDHCLTTAPPQNFGLGTCRFPQASSSHVPTAFGTQRSIQLVMTPACLSKDSATLFIPTMAVAAGRAELTAAIDQPSHSVQHSFAFPRIARDFHSTNGTARIHDFRISTYRVQVENQLWHQPKLNYRLCPPTI